MEELRKKSYDPEKIESEKEYVAKKLGITLKEFEEILKSPPKSYKDYPNNEKKLKFLYRVYKRYFSDYQSMTDQNWKELEDLKQQWNQFVSLSII